LDKAIVYLEEFDLNNQAAVNAIYLVYTIFLKYMVYLYLGKDEQAKDAYEIYSSKKKDLLRINQSKINEVNLLFSIIDDLEKLDFVEAKQKISDSKLIMMPFIKDFISR
jgi:hypothetical protein